MAKRSCHVCPGCCRHRHQLLCEFCEHRRSVCRRHRVDRLVEGSQADLPHVQQAGVGISALQQRRQERLGDGGAGFVVPRHSLQCSGFPDPVLQHLRRGFYKVPLHTRACEHRQFGLRAQLVHHVPELVEERLDVPVRHQSWRVGGWFRKVAHRSSHRNLPRALVITTRLQAEAGSMAILPIPRVHVHVEVADQNIAGSISHLEGLDILVPS
mmetsp:Transcript_54003/g.97243  ORF Transcript_54003/g.97243 Transcript_54003/m.97243 type:complete len:212 (+) Transcript_54003:286-921(+)